jgi:hypothetical protein
LSTKQKLVKESHCQVVECSDSFEIDRIHLCAIVEGRLSGVHFMIRNFGNCDQFSAKKLQKTSIMYNPFLAENIVVSSHKRFFAI